MSEIAETESLPGSLNMYGGFTVEPATLPAAGAFEAALKDALVRWHTAGYRAIWLRLPESKPDHLPIALRAGFRFHHAEPGSAMLTYTLDATASLPYHGTHMIGAGGVVLDDTGHLLVVSERFRRDTSKPYYKLPGGSLDPSEDLRLAVQREVLEETGVAANFEGVVCMRHRHQARFGLSDLYIICRLQALSHEIRHDPGEIDECFWMPIDQFVASDHVAPFNRSIVQRALQGVRMVPVELEHDQGYEFLA